MTIKKSESFDKYCMSHKLLIINISEDIFRRIAVTNMDWDRINATDIFVLLNSVVPSGGSLKCVTGMDFHG